MSEYTDNEMRFLGAVVNSLPDGEERVKLKRVNGYLHRMNADDRIGAFNSLQDKGTIEFKKEFGHRGRPPEYIGLIDNNVKELFKKR